MINKKELSRVAAAMAIIATSTFGCDRGNNGDTREVTPVPRSTPSLVPTPIPLFETETISPTKPLTLEAISLPTPEPIRISRTVIDGEYLMQTFAGIGGEEVISGNDENEGISVIDFGEGYVSQSWGEEINFTTLPEKPIDSLKYLLAMGSYKGVEGLFTPGKQGEVVIYPQMEGLTLPRLPLYVVPPLKDQQYKEWLAPQNFIYYPGTQMTIVGLMDKEVSEGELDYALVSVTDYLRSSKDGVPRHYLAKIPTYFSADSDNKNAFSLANLLEANGYGYDPNTKVITFFDKESNQETLLELNKIQGEELVKGINQTVGIYFVDRREDELIKNPVVPYPAEMPAVWDINELKDELGNVSLVIRGQNQTGELQDFARARYNQESEKWEWKKITPLQEVLEVEQQLKQDILELYTTLPGGGEEAERALERLEEAKKHDPQKMPECIVNYSILQGFVGGLVGEYYASGDSFENRNQDIFKVLAQIRDLARQNMVFNENDWIVEGIDY